MQLAQAVVANNNGRQTAAAEQMRLKAQTQKVINKALALALSKSEIGKVMADNGNCDEETLGRITKSVERVLDHEYQGDTNALFINMENTLNEQYKVILADECLVTLLIENNKDFIEKIQNVVREVEAVAPVAPAAAAPVHLVAEQLLR
ncbi:hypothetical protein [Candidatus Rickettsia kedanie]|uniref:Uncharacterized protein n=1 Tax=Candidatus Rickettsia kedanie TaxID=3115352 RepID=A0ABP9U0B0_9RICK